MEKILQKEVYALLLVLMTAESICIDQFAESFLWSEKSNFYTIQLTVNVETENIFLIPWTELIKSSHAKESNTTIKKTWSK